MQEILFLYCHAFSNLNYPSVSQASRISADHHRIIEMILWVRRTLKDQFVPTLCCSEEHLSLDRVSQSCIQPGLEHFQIWSTPCEVALVSWDASRHIKSKE